MSYCPFTSVRKYEKQKHKIATPYHDNLTENEFKLYPLMKFSKQPLIDGQPQSKEAQRNGKLLYNCGAGDEFIQVIDLDILRLSTNINSLLRDVVEFLGCFALDCLPPFPTEFPKTMIINTDYKSGPGEHWVAVILLKYECIYFDSFGLGVVESEILNYLKCYYKSCIRSNICIQDVTSTKCGAFCVAFLLSVKNKMNYNKFIGHFNAPLLIQNDIILKRYFLKFVFKVKKQPRLLKQAKKLKFHYN
jgi:hypothetical protein